jgi:KipI family sensor histidine kinase inhibitor
MPARVLPCGERALLVEVGSLDDVLALRHELWEVERPAGLVDAVPGARSLLLVADTAAGFAAMSSAVARTVRDLPRPGVGDPSPTRRAATQGAPPAAVEIAVRYDGPDLDEVARLTGLSTAGVVAAHTGTPWQVGFGGFAPGFAYLVGGDPRLRVARRPSPRAAVPAGSVGLAGEFSGIYPRASPGGWQLIGRTDAVLWDLDRDPPALLQPGALVRFVDAGIPREHER